MKTLSEFRWEELMKMYNIQIICSVSLKQNSIIFVDQPSSKQLLRNKIVLGPLQNCASRTSRISLEYSKRLEIPLLFFILTLYSKRMPHSPCNPSFSHTVIHSYVIQKIIYTSFLKIQTDLISSQQLIFY